MNLRHYYHLYADGDYRDIVREHFTALKASGLLPLLLGLHVGFVGSERNIAEAKALVSEIAGRRFSSNSATAGWEQETLDVLHRDAISTTPFLALYAHTKGASNPDPINEAWRRKMLLHTVTRWRDAVAQLNGPVAAAGCFRLVATQEENGVREAKSFFAGTFWWARSDCLARIGPPARDDRLDAETWIDGLTKSQSPPRALASLYDGPVTLADGSEAIISARVPPVTGSRC